MGAPLLTQSPRAVCLQARIKTQDPDMSPMFFLPRLIMAGLGEGTLKLPRKTRVHDVGVPGKGMLERKTDPGPCSGMGFSPLPGERVERGPLKLPGKWSRAPLLDREGPRLS